MKKSIFLFFAAILCAMTANAYNQSAVDLYFDNSTAKWTNCYVYIGHSSWTSVYAMSRVSGTQYLWKLPANFNGGKSWDNATGWVVCYEKWWDSNGETIDKFVHHGAKNVTEKKTSAWSASYIYKADGTKSVTSDSKTETVYKLASSTKSNYTVTINTVEGGALTVKDYDNNAVATGASKIHLTVLKFSAAPASGYVLEGVQINDGSTTTTISASEINTKTHTLTSNVTITPVWKATTSTVTVTTNATNGTVTGGGVVEEGTSVTLTATADAGYQFKNWTVAGAEVSTANPYTFTVDADITVTANFEETPKATIYFVNNSGWSKIQAYAWDGTKGANPSWPGADITANKLGEQICGFDVYSYTVEQGSYGKVIFNNGSAQTADYVWTDGNYYWYDSAIKKEDKFAGGTKADAESALAAVVNYDYYLTGSLVGGWDPKQKGIEKDGELYKATFADLAAGTYEFKITKGDWAQQWNYSNLDKAYEEVSEGKDGEGNPNGNIKIVTTAVKTITVIFDATANKISFEGLTPYVAPLTYTVTVPAGTEKCFIAGAMNGWNFQEMTPTANANEFTIDIAGARESDGYKYACKADWDYVEKKEDGNDLDANRTWTANDVVAKWGVPPTYTIVGATAITGENWNLASTNNIMIKDGEAYTLTKTDLQLEVGDYEYKVAKNGAWGDGQYPAEGNEKVTITENGIYTIVYTYTVGTSLTAVATKTGEYTPVQTVYTVAGDAALCGSDWKADDTTNDMTDNGDGTFTWKKTDVKLTSNVGFKVVKNHDFGNGEYPAENWNINLVDYEGAAVYTVTITFTESSKEIAVTLTKTGEATPPVITYVLMGVNNDWTTGIALTRNEANTEFEEYMLLGQAISATDAVKVVKLVDGEKNTFCGDVKEGSAEHTTDGDGNIVLAEGTYDFYYDVPANKVYIGKQVAPTTIDVTLSGMVATPQSRMGSYSFLSLNDEDGNQISIFNGTEGAYGDDFKVNAYLAAYDVTVVGTGDWNVVDGVETLTATLQVEDDNTTIYNVTATVGVATTIPLECYDATYTITDPEFNEVTFTGVADGKEFTILVSYFGGEYYSEGEWGETFIMGTEVDFDDSDAEAYYLGGTYIDDASNTYEVLIFATPAAVEPTPDYTRTTTAGNFGTICLEFGSTNYTGMELYEFVGKEEGKAYIASVTTLEAGVPYIFRATASELAVYSDGTTAATPGDHNGLHGTFTDDTEVTVGNYILFNNAICEVTATCWVNANRAYIVWNEIPTGAPQQMPGRKYIGMDVTGENEATGFENITNGENTTIKVIENGQLIIIRNGEKFNAQGQKL